MGAPTTARLLPLPREVQRVGGRPRVRGKFIERGGERLYLRGVTYGTFHPTTHGLFPEPEVVKRDFGDIAAAGFNAIRIYAAPPRWLLDLAHESGLVVLVGFGWESHTAFLENPGQADEIEARVRAETRACAGHPALLGFAIANEIPATIARWYGKRRLERFIKRLYDSVKEEDAEALLTYVNFPSTEYLSLPFLDFVCFNVYLESQQQLDAYIARLQNLAGDRPLVMAEIGLDSLRNGEDEQARTLRWQVETTAAGGCAGAFVFAWTDEWHTGGRDVHDWDFGLTRRDRSPKPALGAVIDAFERFPIQPGLDWPSVSVIVCTRNGARTIDETLTSLMRLDYPNYEVVVVDDGSNDDTADIARRHDVRLIQTENRGLSSARNSGLAAARGEVVAYIDDDAWPDPDWLTQIVHTLRRSEAVAVGGPNLPPPGDGQTADAVANAPGGPVHVLLSDRKAEHIPGCNMAAWKACLEEIGGFDPQFRCAGDDVDLCWRLEEHGYSIAFNPAAVVWHHRRNSVRAYWKQQKGYGNAEALVERKWPDKYNRAGHPRWGGRLYGNGLTWPLARRRSRVFHGIWGNALFQRMYQPQPGTVGSLPLMPEWYLLIGVLAGVSVLGMSWHPLLAFVPLLVAATVAVAAQALLSARHATPADPSASRMQRLGLRTRTAGLFLLQPLARLTGRLGHGLTPWRRRRRNGWRLPRKRVAAVWSDEVRPLADRLRDIEADTVTCGAAVRRGSEFDRWDLEIRGGVLGSVRLQTTIEDHRGGRQLFRMRAWPSLYTPGVVAAFVLAALGAAAVASGVPVAGALLLAAAALVTARMVDEAGAATELIMHALEGQPTRRRTRARPWSDRRRS